MVNWGNYFQDVQEWMYYSTNFSQKLSELLKKSVILQRFSTIYYKHMAFSILLSEFVF